MFVLTTRTVISYSDGKPTITKLFRNLTIILLASYFHISKKEQNIVFVDIKKYDICIKIIRFVECGFEMIRP